MNWKYRLLGISLAGGTVLAGCSSSDPAGPGPTDAGDAGDAADAYQIPPTDSGQACNANPDPCCRDDASAACIASKLDAGHDAGTDGSSDDASDLDATAPDGDAEPAHLDAQTGG